MTSQVQDIFGHMYGIIGAGAYKCTTISFQVVVDTDGSTSAMDSIATAPHRQSMRQHLLLLHSNSLASDFRHAQTARCQGSSRCGDTHEKIKFVIISSRQVQRNRSSTGGDVHCVHLLQRMGRCPVQHMLQRQWPHTSTVCRANAAVGVR